MLGIIILVLVLLSFFLLSSAIVYHLWRYSPEKKQAVTLIFIYLAVSAFLVFFLFVSFSKINWFGN